MRIGHGQELELVRELLERAGVPEDAATVQARWLAEADLRGHPSHGLQRLPVIVERIRRGLIDPGARPAIVWRTESVAVIDGGRGLGPWVGMRAVEAIVERARSSGIAVAAIANANHLGMLAPYVEEIAAAGQIGVAMTTSEALVHPWGGARAMVGTNPIAVAVPAEPDPFVLDMATGAVSMGKILDHRHRGAPLEPGWAIDSDGRDTVEAAAASAISPFGGAKGYALALALELIVAATTGTALGTDVTGTLDVETVCNKGDVLIAVDCAVDVSGYLRALRATPARPGTDGVAIPGDGARARRRAALEHGVEVSDAVWEQVQRLREGVAA